MALITLAGNKVNKKRDRKNIQLKMPTPIVEIKNSLFMLYEFEKIVLLKALIMK